MARERDLVAHSMVDGSFAWCRGVARVCERASVCEGVLVGWLVGLGLRAGGLEGDGGPGGL